jgi:hypothetical protein
MRVQTRSVKEKSSALAWLGGVFGMAGAKRKAPLKGGLRIAIGAVADALSALPLSGMTAFNQNAVSSTTRVCTIRCGLAPRLLRSHPPISTGPSAESPTR